MPIELDATDAAPRLGATPHDRTAAADSAPRDPGAVGGGALDRTATVAGSARARREDSTLGPGTRLAHFRIERKVGEGGMGQVWLATDLALDRPVALKLLLADVGGDGDRRQRLIREARSQARLVHPNVCHIYFIGEDDGRLFFAMEYVDGETLAQRLSRGALPPDEAIELTRMAALGLRAADAAGFTHRDIKPSNLMIDRHGNLKVMDFGLVTSSPEPRATDAAAAAAPVAASALVGTPLYMAPEQGRGEAVDRRADIYALGATLHHMIAGAPPFSGDTAAELLSRHETGARPRLTAAAPVRRRATLVDEVVDHMMAKRAADRYATYDEVIEALDLASTRRTRPAGMSARTIAGLLDLLIAAMTILPLALLLPQGDGNMWLVLVAGLIYPLALARWGATPGRALLDLEVIRHRGTGHIPYLHAVLRYIVAYGPLAIGTGVTNLGEVLEIHLLDTIGGLIAVLGTLYVFGEAARVALRSVDKRTIWDRVSGTRTCYRRRSVA